MVRYVIFLYYIKIHCKKKTSIMAKKARGLYAKIPHEPIFHKTSIGRNPSKAKMNKSRRRSFKKYRGQGK